MQIKMLRSRLRREFNISATTLLTYYGIMNVAVMGVMILDIIIIAIRQYSIQGPDFELTEEMIAMTANNGLGYFLAIAVGTLIMILWKKRQFCFHEIWRSNNRMRFGSFWAILCFFVSGQAFAQLYAVGVEWVLNQFGLSAMEAMEAASGMSESVTLFIYGAFLAPIFEEILFRGLILRTLMRTGKKFAIFASAYFFGMFHGNIIQTPFAFLVGLVLGYVAAEYSMWWAILLHMINNLILGEVLPHVIEPLPVMGQEVIYAVINWGCAITAVVIGIVKRKEIKKYLFEKRMQAICFKCFFTSPVVLTFSALMLLNMILIFIL